MNTYTVGIQAAGDGDIWQAVAPAEVVTSDDTAEEVAGDVAGHQTVITAGRVVVWHGDLTGPEHSSPRDADAAAVHVVGAADDIPGTEVMWTIPAGAWRTVTVRVYPADGGEQVIDEVTLTDLAGDEDQIDQVRQQMQEYDITGVSEGSYYATRIS